MGKFNLSTTPTPRLIERIHKVFIIGQFLNPGWLFVCSENFLHHADDFAQRGIGMHSIHDIWHRIFRALAGDAQLIQSLAYTAIVARLADLLEPRNLPLVPLWIHLEQGDGQRLVFSIGVHTNDLAVTCVNFALITIGCI